MLNLGKFWLINTYYYIKLRIKYKSIMENNDESYLYDLLNNYVKNTLKYLKIDIIIKNEEIKANLKDNALYIANHESIYDSLISYQAIGGKSGYFTAGDKRDVTKFKYLYGISKLLGIVFVDRKSIRGSVKASKQGAEVLKSGKNLVIFPEGEVNKHLDKSNRQIAKFHAGSFRPAIEAKKVIVPTVIIGAGKIHNALNMNRKINSGTVEVVFLEPIDIHLHQNIKSVVLAEMVEEKINTYLEEING